MLVLKRVLLFSVCLLAATALQAGVIYTVSIPGDADISAMTLSHTFSDYLVGSYTFTTSDIVVDPLSTGTTEFYPSAPCILTIDGTGLATFTDNFFELNGPDVSSYFYEVKQLQAIQLPAGPGSGTSTAYVKQYDATHNTGNVAAILTLSVTDTVPEPGVFGMAGIGLVGLVALLRRRRAE